MSTAQGFSTRGDDEASALRHQGDPDVERSWPTRLIRSLEVCVRGEGLIEADGHAVPTLTDRSKAPQDQRVVSRHDQLVRRPDDEESGSPPARVDVEGDGDGRQVSMFS